MAHRGAAGPAEAHQAFLRREEAKGSPTAPRTDFFAQQPAPADKTQAMMMKIMPLLLLGFYLFLPSGLVLYYIVNSAITIVQQRYINNLIEKEAKAKRS